MNEAAWCYLEGFGCKKDKVSKASLYSWAAYHLIILETNNITIQAAAVGYHRRVPDFYMNSNCWSISVLGINADFLHGECLVLQHGSGTCAAESSRFYITRG